MTVDNARALRGLGALVTVAAAVACGSGDEGVAPPASDQAPEGPRDPGVPSAGSEEGPSDEDPDKDADPDAPSPPDDPAISPATQAQLIERFAPHLHLHPDDAYRPANVDWYLARVKMRFHHESCPDHELLGVGKVTQQTLVARSHEDNRSFCRHDASKKVLSTNSERFFLEIASDATYEGAPRAEWKTYVAWRPQSSGLVNVEYWFFYPFNDAFALFNHESDWEHVRVTIDPKAEGGQGKALEVKMSAHKGGTIMKLGDARLSMDGGTHPVTYVAKGTHANYPTVGTFTIDGTYGVAKDTAKAAAPSAVWKTEGSTILVGTRAAPKNGQVFIKYWGRWGELGDLPETNGVTRHFP